MSAYMSSAGLSLDIVGIILLFFYGLPKDIHKKGVPDMTWDGELIDPKGWVHYKILARIGLAIIIVGFTLQIISNHV